MRKRRTLKEIRRSILLSFDDNDISIRELSKKSKIDWYTAQRQLIFLKGMDLVNEVFRHRLLRLFHITELGKEIVAELNSRSKMKKIQNDEEFRLIKLIKKNFELK